MSKVGNIHVVGIFTNFIIDVDGKLCNIVPEIYCIFYMYYISRRRLDPRWI